MATTSDPSSWKNFRRSRILTKVIRCPQELYPPAPAGGADVRGCEFFLSLSSRSKMRIISVPASDRDLPRFLG
jgi:hypothetical protein